MGNTRIQDRVTGSIMGLKEGFIPLGMKEYGGVLYIASYNPTTKTSELGTIPSPLFDYTQSLSDVYNSHNIELFNSATFSVCDYPIILDSKKYLYYAGDSIVCGLDITNCNQSLKRESFEYPIISTRDKAGLITLHALSVPSNSQTFVDL
jgi:hypothetical protein